MCQWNCLGAELREVLAQTMDKKWGSYPLMGLGFRGKIMGKMVYSGISMKRNKEHLSFFIHGKPLESGKTYLVAIPDMFTFGKFFPSIFRAKNKHYFLPDFMRHVLEWKLVTDNRIRHDFFPPYIFCNKENGMGGRDIDD